MGLATDVNFVVSAELTKNEDINSVARVPYDFAFEKKFATDEADKVWADARTLAIGASEDIDVLGGITDVFGVPITLATIKAIAINSMGDLKLGDHADNILLLDSGSGLLIPADAGLFVASPNGWPVAANTNIIRIENISGAELEYSILVIGLAA